MATSLEAFSIRASTDQRRNAPVVSRGSSRCPSLVELATAKVSAKIKRGLKEEDWRLLRMLSPTVLLNIHDQLLSQHRLSTDAWIVISTNLLAWEVDTKRCMHGYASRAFSPAAGGTIDPKDFTLQLGLAWSPDVNFITHLTLTSKCRLDKEYLLMLPGMQNLGMLRIVEPRDPDDSGARINDRVVRGWSEKINPFPVLRILQLSCCTEITPECLRYLSRFPSLVYFTIRGNAQHWMYAYKCSTMFGWRALNVLNDIRVLMMRYFASCLGLQEGLPAHLLHASERISRNKRAESPCLFGDSDAVTFGERPTVLPWKGRIPENVAMESPREVEASMKAQDDSEKPCDNPMWWIYNALGHVIFRDEDLKSVNGNIGTRVPTSNGWSLPPLPVLTLSMIPPHQPRGAGVHNTKCGYGSPEDAESHVVLSQNEKKYAHRLAKHTFVRHQAFDGVATRRAPWKPMAAGPTPAKQDEVLVGKRGPKPGMIPRKRKRQTMNDLLSMGGG